MDSRHVHELARTDRSRVRRALAPLALAAIAGLTVALAACGGSGDERVEPASTTGSTASGSLEAPAPPSAPEFGFADSAVPSDAAAAQEALKSGGGGEGVSGNAPTQDGGDGLASFDFLGRSIIRSGSLELEVEGVGVAYERVSTIATGAGGFVSQSRFLGTGESQSATLTVRVPADRFEDVIGQLRGIATEVRVATTSSQDVTGEVADLESTLRNLRAVEARYVEMLGSARTIQEILQVQDRLNQTRDSIERVEGRRQTLGRLADMSTLTVSLYPVAVVVPAEASGLGVVGEAWQESLDTLGEFGVGVLVVIAYAWWVLPLVAIALWFGFRALRGLGITNARRGNVVSIDTPQGTA